MGRGSDTRLYNSRSESSTMFRYNDGYESRYNPGDPEYLDAEKEKKQKEQSIPFLGILSQTQSERG